MRRCVARVGNEVPRMTFLFFLFSSVRLFLLASRSFRQSTLASKFRGTDPGLHRRIPLSHPRCSHRIGVELDERSNQFFLLEIFENSQHPSRCVSSSSSSSFAENRTLFPLFPDTRNSFDSFFPLGLWGFLVTTLSLRGINRYNKINFPLPRSSLDGAWSEGNGRVKVSVNIGHYSTGIEFSAGCRTSCFRFPPRSDSDGTASWAGRYQHDIQIYFGSRVR